MDQASHAGGADYSLACRRHDALSQGADVVPSHLLTELREDLTQVAWMCCLDDTCAYGADTLLKAAPANAAAGGSC